MSFVIGLLAGPIAVIIGVAVVHLRRAIHLHLCMRHWRKQLCEIRETVASNSFARASLITGNTTVTRRMVMDEFLPDFEREIPKWANDGNIRCRLEICQDMDRIMLIFAATRVEYLRMVREEELGLQRARVRLVDGLRLLMDIGTNNSIEEEYFNRNPIHG